MNREPVTYRTGFDRWMAVALAAAVGPGVIIGWQVPKATVIQCIVAAYLVLTFWWFYRHTYYTFDDLALHVHFGPLAADIPYGLIRHAAPGHRAKAGYAMSLDRLVIEFGEDESVLISPADREGFLAELHRRAPQAVIDAGDDA